MIAAMDISVKDILLSTSRNIWHDAYRLVRLSLPGLLSVIPFLFLGYWTLVYLYRVTFHPLTRFPGPKLAAATFWYEFWYDVFPGNGQYTFKIRELHERYGKLSLSRIGSFNHSHFRPHNPDQPQVYPY